MVFWYRAPTPTCGTVDGSVPGGRPLAPIFVFVGPGHTVFMRTPSRAYSRAADFESWITAPLEAAYVDTPTRPTRPPIDATLTTAPPPLAMIAGIPYFMPRKTPRRLVLTTRSNSASSTSTSGPPRWMTPA